MITNTVNLDYTSLPGPLGTAPNPTGSVLLRAPAGTRHVDRRAGRIGRHQ